METPPPDAANDEIAPPDCARCGKPAALCVCESIVAIDNRVTLLILQHPQEQDRMLGTARLTALHFRDAVFRVGLSWPSLAKALGRPADPARWVVLHLGSAAAEKLAPGREIVVLDRKGQVMADQDAALADIDGVVLLDGTWAQAKTLWWRNPWVLKARRAVLGPRRPSRYGALRREPRRDGLSTIEAAALLLARIENRPEIETALHASFARMLERYRAQETTPKPKSPPRGRRYRRRS
jgi:DTW domain-containing protein YfiP